MFYQYVNLLPFEGDVTEKNMSFFFFFLRRNLKANISKSLRNGQCLINLILVEGIFELNPQTAKN